MMIYKIPVIERQAFGDFTRQNAKYTKYINVDDIGLRFFYNDNEKNPIKQFEKKHIALSKEEMFFLILADNVERAITVFYSFWEGARVGGDKPTQKALQINKDKPVLELPLCSLMSKNEKNQFVCGPISPKYESGLCLSEEDENDGAIFDGKVNDCPVKIFYESIKLEKKMGSLNIIKTSWGFNYIPYMLKIDE